ncbi:hypothetical protein HYR69_01645 [Candidatus Sumerlaeota bacterium]|nr:hypothetical protein [Candidatus Sumerlaeota bacterium]
MNGILIPRWIVCAIGVLGFSGGVRAAAVFSPPEKITDTAAKYQLSRTANHLMAIDSAGTLHVTYWAGGAATTPATPSYIYYRNWRLGAGWSAQQAIDDSVVASQHVGGRHPSIAILPNDTVWIVWHDHRNCTAGGNWIDNIEIYGDFMPGGGAFSSGDTRLTTSSAAHLGDDGYLPRIAVQPGASRLSLAWYDYHVDGSVSDIYLKASDALGNFNLSDTMASMQATNQNNRGNAPSYTVVDMDIDGAGTRHLTWAGGIGPDVNLYYAQAPAGATSVTEQLLAAGGTDFNDPPHIAVATNGDVWIAYGDNAATPNENVVLLRKRSGQPAFDGPFNVKATTAREYFPDHEIDSSGKVHLVWIDERSGRHVYYGVFNPAIPTLVEEIQVTQTSGQWIRPTIALGAAGEIYILFEKDTGINTGEIWFATTAVQNAVAGWTEYE